jgi:FixJ family two-component response regulator
VPDLKQARETILSRVATLTPQERQVFELIVRGKSNKAAAGVLHLSARTVKAHRIRVMKKMQVRSIVELVSLAERGGVLADIELLTRTHPSPD